MKDIKEKKAVSGNCLTKPLLLAGVSGCLVENPQCGYAQKIGFSYMCRHAEHKSFDAELTGGMTPEQTRNLYLTLRQKRRDDFVSGLDEAAREFFCRQTDFFGEPLPDKDHDIAA
jgi:hypothetical protein